MKLDIRCIGFDLTPAIESYIEKRLEKLGTYFSNPDNLRILAKCSIIRDEQLVELSLSSDDLTIRAEEKSRDLYESIDAVEKKLVRQIHKYKTKMNRHLRKDFSTPIPDMLTEEPVDDSLEIVRKKAYTSKPMTAEEAVLEMNLLDHTFFVFQDASTGETQVVYKRRDGKYGLITPDPFPNSVSSF